MRMRLRLEQCLPRWPQAFDEVVPVANALDATAAELQRCGFLSLFDGVTGLNAARKAGRHLIVVRAVHFHPGDDGAESVMARVRDLQNENADRFFGLDCANQHRVLLVAFRTRFDSADPAEEWIEEFFNRIPKLAAPSDSPVWRELSRTVEGAGPLRCQFQVAEVGDTGHYTRYLLGALVWQRSGGSQADDLRGRFR